MTATPDHWLRLQQLFEDARRQPAAQRSRFLAQACHDDEALRVEVERLLQHADDAADPVAGIVGDAAQDVVSQTHAWHEGRRIGAWKLLRHLADGGMGAVWLAERADGTYQQQAALKLLNPALMSPAMRTRFVAERQILAQLDHPHIARLLDGGETDDGLPYLVMQYVDGRPIDDQCHEDRLPTAARLRLFLDLCDAVAYAHRNLVVHRDIKPANVLVDRQGRPVLLDFGVARLIDGAGAAVTVTGQRALTPSHASPEQIKGEAITTATDVYALGVLLYQLLCGQLPFAVAGRTPAQIALDILESDPPRPSATAARADAANRRLDGLHGHARALAAGRLRRELAGDLDNIVLKALHKDPARRYATVPAFAADVLHVLEHRPVSARADAFGYRAGKYIRRHRAGVALAAGATLTIAAVVAGYTWQLALARDRAEAARQDAVTEARRAGQTARFLEDLFAHADPEHAGQRDVTAAQLLDRGAERIQHELRDQPAVRAQLLATMGTAFASLDELPKARASLEAAERLLANGPAAGEALCDVRLKLGQFYVRARQLDAAERTFGSCTSATLQPEAMSRSQALHLAALAGVALARGEPRKGEALQRAALSALRRLSGDPSADVFDALGGLARLLAGADRLPEAERVLQQRVAQAPGLFGADSPAMADALLLLAGTQQRLKLREPAVANARRGVAIVERLNAADSLRVARARSILQGALNEADQNAEALQLAEQILATYRRHYPPGHEWVVGASADLAGQYLEMGRYAEVEALVERTLATGASEDSLRARVSLAQLAQTLGSVREDQKRWRDAERQYRRGLELLGPVEPQHRATRMLRENLAWALGRQHRFAEGDKIYRTLIEISTAHQAHYLPQEHGRLLETYAEWLDMMQRPAMAAAVRSRYKAEIEAGAAYIHVMREQEDTHNATAAKALGR